jgi:hypothetical protein
MGAVGIHPMAVDTGRSTDRKKDLQNATLWAVRAMRAVFCRKLRQKIVLLADPDLLTSTMILQGRLERR